MPVFVDYFRNFQTFGGPKIIGPASADQPDPLLRLCISAIVMHGAWCHLALEPVCSKMFSNHHKRLIIHWLNHCLVVGQ